ncbi:hypothetical protein CAURIS_00195 [Corynebacterium auris]|nr:hypothetical protein CAURIS_00195 [Corynebacterium auris]
MGYFPESVLGYFSKSADIAPGTTRNYLSSAMSKVGAHNRYEAYTLARDRGWV